MAFGASISRLGSDALMPEEVSAQIFDGVTQQSIILPAMTRLPNMARLQERLPILDVLPTAYFVTGDDGLRQTTSLKWRNKYLEAAEVAVICPVPQNVIDDAGQPIWSLAVPKIQQAIAQVTDSAILIGAGAPSVWPSGMKQQATASGQTLSIASFTNAYQALAGVGGAFSKLEAVGYDATGGVGAMSFKAQLRGMVDSNARPLLLGVDSGVGMAPQFSVAGVPFTFAKNAAFVSTDAQAIIGDTKEAIYAYRQDLNMRIVIDGVISDNQGKVVINLTQQRMSAILMWVRMAWQVPNPPTLLSNSGSTNEDANQNNQSRSPFVLVTT